MAAAEAIDVNGLDAAGSAAGATATPLILRIRQFWREDGVFLLFMGLLFALRFWPAFWDGKLYAPFRDNVWLYGSLFSRASEIALTGNCPYWIDTVLGGFSLYTTPHFSITYPFYFFGFLNYGKAIQVMYTLSYVTCFHSAILYLNLYIMLRTAGAKGLASFAAAAIGLVSSNTENYAHWITIAAAFSWFPLLVAGMIRLVRAPLAFGSIAIFALAAALICTASPAQPVIQSALVSAMFFTVSVIWRWRKDGIRQAGALTLGLAVSGVIAFALCAAAFVPMARATGEMMRAVGWHSAVYGHAPIPWEAFNASQLEPHQLSHLLFGSGNISALGGIYVGPLALLGLLLCIVAFRHAEKIERFLLSLFGAMALYFLIAAFGTHFGLAYLHFHVPLLNRMREATRHLVVFTTFAALLSGIGFQTLIDVITNRLELSANWRRYLWIATTFGILVFVVALAVDHYAKPGSWLVLGLVPVTFFLLPIASLGRRLLACGFILFACLASFLAPPGTVPFATSEYLRKDNLTSHRVLRRVAQLPDIFEHRVAIIDPDFPPMTWADNASFYGIRTFYFHFTPLPLVQLKEMNDEKLNLRRLRGGKYLICNPKSDCPDAQAKLLFTESGYRVYELSYAMGQYALVHAIKPFPTSEEFRASVIDGFDFQHIVGLQGLAAQRDPILRQLIQKPTSAESLPNEFEEIVRSPNLFGIMTSSEKMGVFILNERWSRDWHVRVDSRPAGLLQANFVQPAVAVGAGRHYIEFEYKPVFFWYLMLLQRITFLAIVGLALWQWGRWCLPPSAPAYGTSEQL
jgi:hypothetical protein